ncbi:hypothetical protein [Actinomadura rudentiformis]|uniref:hypothetical protein n=1 Tax=Actinomadura rudentiformis TaxID=359158 RepID=UPI001CEF6835|nr:hypothetical protein [Actinomadura rudentiformis]
MRVIALGIAALVLVGVAATIVYATLIDTKELRYQTQAELLNSTRTTAGAELRSRGVPLSTALSCAHMPGWTDAKMRVACTGTTADKKAVQVLASGEREKREHYYTILLDGRPIVENAHCLGTDCQKQN